MIVSIGSAAGVLGYLARRHAPEDGWHELLRSGVRSARAKELTFVDRADGAAPGGLDDLFIVGQPVEWPAYTEVPELRKALGRVRRLLRRPA